MARIQTAGLRRWFVLAGLILATLLIVLLYPDLRGLRNSVQDLFGYGGFHFDDGAGSRDLFHLGVDISGTRDRQTYASFDLHRDGEATASFHGFGCLQSCDDHKAGYRWAVRHGVRRPSECGGLSWGFIEGCAAHAIPPSS